MSRFDTSRRATHARRNRRAWTLLALLIAVLPLARPAAAQVDPDDVLLTPHDRIDKAPRISGDYLTWTQDVTAIGSHGNVRVRHLPSGTEWDLGPGFASDVTEIRTDAAAANCGAPEARVAWLAVNPVSTRLEVRSACLRAGVWNSTVIAGGLPWADHVRVTEQYTAWSARAPGGRIALFVNDGAHTQILSGEGHAFRPAFVFDAAQQRLALLWDEYIGVDAGALDYEVFLRMFRPGVGWEAPENLSQAPGATDMAPDGDFGPDGRLWVTWQTDRGDIAHANMVLRRKLNGEIEYPQPFPASEDPAQLGLVNLEVVRGTFTPNLRVDELGRVWLFAQERPSGATGGGPYNKEIRYTLYDGQAWCAPKLLSHNWRDERWLDLEVLGEDLFAVYQSYSLVSRSVDVVGRMVCSDVELQPMLVTPSSLPAAPQAGYAVPQLPEQRVLDPSGENLRLVFGDLHSHTGRSPDGMGELDHALFWARDFARLDFWASTDHDERGGHEFTDWEFDLGRRFVALFDSADFAAFHGFEWTNGVGQYTHQIVGHRATVDAPELYRNTDMNADELGEYYALMAAADAIGVPHHLGKLGGATFLLWDPFVQPITEISSVHGIYEDEVQEKYAVDDHRFGVTAAGDDHSASPGLDGLAGAWIPADAPLSRAAVKTALRTRRTFGVLHDGLWVDFRVNGAPMGSELTHGDKLFLEYELRELPVDGPFNVNITRDGDDTHPVHRRQFPAGTTGCVKGLAILPPVHESAWFMLRVSLGEGSDAQDTIFWSTPVWVDPAPPSAGPVIPILHDEQG